jgi:hypothetical protein
MKTAVWKLNEYDWWMGENFEDVKKAYLEEIGEPEDEAIQDPHCLTPVEMENTPFRDEDGIVTKFAGEFYRILWSSDHPYDGKPRFFASTEY